jgi:hypothetical protein
MPAERILVCGYYGFANAGDEAILAGLLEDLAAGHPGAEVVVMAGAPEAVAADHGVEAFEWQDVARMVEEAERAHLMVLGGGGLFQDQHGFATRDVLTSRHGSVGYYAGFALLAGMTATPLVIYGVGVGPLATEDARRLTRVAFRRASAASVRDEASLALLAALGVDTGGIRVTADPAWSLRPAAPAVVPEILRLEGVIAAGRSTVGVAVRPWGDPTWTSALAAALDRLVEERDARVLFVPFQESPHPHENDAGAALEVARRMDRIDRTAILRGGYTPAERAALLGSCDLVIGMRLHSVVFAAIGGVPVAAIAYDPKVRTVMEQLDLADQLVELSRLSAETVVSVARRAGPVSPHRVEALRTRAAANRSILTAASACPPLDAESQGEILRIALDRVRRQAGLESRVAELTDRSAGLEDANQRVTHDRDELAARYRSIVDSRAFKAVSRYWGARRGIRTAAGKAADAAPSPVRPVLKRLAGPPGRPAPVEPEAADPATRRRIAGEIAAVLAGHADVPGIVVYPPSIGWNMSLFQRPQQMALAFARLGYLVFYGLEHLGSEGAVGIREVAPGVYLTFLPPGMTDLLAGIPRPLAVTYVYNYDWTRNLKEPTVVFEHIDELEVFTTSFGIAELRSWYQEAIAGADLVVASARDLLDKVRASRPDAVLCPNGVDYRHFAGRRPGPPPEDIADIAGIRPIAGYYGAIAEWIDFPLIRAAAEALPEVEFVFIGPQYDESVTRHLEVFDLPNVRWLGPKDYHVLPDYLHHFDVATIPFLVNDVTHAVSPLKLFEYMAGGRSVVTPNLRECARYEAVLVADGPADYVAKIRRALELRNDPDHQALLRRTARANTWDMRAGTLIDALARARR